MIEVKVKLDKDILKGDIDKIKDEALLNQAAASGIAEEIRGHLRREYVPRNQNGDFWSDVLESIEVSHKGKSSVIRLTEIGIRLRYYGGEVRPGKSISSFTGKTTKALAVPTKNVPIKGGRRVRPGRYDGLIAFLSNKRGGDTSGYLVEGEEVTRKRKSKRGDKGSKYIKPKKGGSLLYTLRKVTRHKADKNILPSNETLMKSGKKAILNLIK